MEGVHKHIIKGNVRTSEKVKDVVRCLFWLAALMAAMAVLAFVAKGTKMNDT